METQISVSESVRDMYTRYPFPPVERRNAYQNHAKFVRSVLENLGIKLEGARFGDIACGTGCMLTDYAREFPEVSFQGWDLSPESLKMAESFLAEEGLTNAQVDEQNIMELEVVDSFDYIVSWGTIHHLENTQEGVRRLCRALKVGGVLRTGVYGYYGNRERRLQQEFVDTLVPDKSEFQERITAVKELAQVCPGFATQHTEPPVELDSDNWVVDEFLHVWEKHIKLVDLVQWLQDNNMEVKLLTDFYDQEIPLDIAKHTTNNDFINRVSSLPFVQQCAVIELLTRPYWLSVIAQKVA
ncbi:MAG: class I SAM-dependent methyltransferase [Trichodesmium sp. MO_231.B1]|nr:class I SAM-dependent methyltransferase [Trichodesmium sp. MO_231.B1]